MDIYTKNKILVRVVIVLLLLNLIALATWFLGQQKEPNPKLQDMASLTLLLKDKLQLNDSQILAMQNLRTHFFAEEKVLAAHIRAGRDSMNMEMFNEHSDSLLLSQLALHVSENEYKMEKLRIQQAKQFKELLSPNQRLLLRDFVKEIRDYFKPEKEPKKQH